MNQTEIDELIRMGHRGEWEGVRSAIREAGQEVVNAGDSIGTPILVAFARLGDLETARLLISHGADVNQITKDGVTPLVACLYGAKDGFDTQLVMQHLLNNGADPNFFAFMGKTPLHFAASYRLPGYVRLLLAHGADPNLKTRNEFPESAIEIARRTKSANTVRAFESGPSGA
jgi:uncharacterized protein